MVFCVLLPLVNPEGLWSETPKNQTQNAAHRTPPWANLTGVTGHPSGRWRVRPISPWQTVVIPRFFSGIGTTGWGILI
jgi:hypothetical protein